MRAEKPEKLVAEMQTLELIDELKTRKNGDDMSWDGFKHMLGNYPGIKKVKQLLEQACDRRDLACKDSG